MHGKLNFKHFIVNFENKDFKADAFNKSMSLRFSVYSLFIFQIFNRIVLFFSNISHKLDNLLLLFLYSHTQITLNLHINRNFI